MASTTEVPLTIRLDAAARIAEWGLQRQFEQMLEQVRKLIPDLRRIEVVLEPPYDTHPDEYVVIDAFVPFRGEYQIPGEMAYHDWAIASFSMDELEHIHVMVNFDHEYGR
jgi:hypothetical protein